MSDPKMIREIMEAVTIPVMAKARIGHFVECQVSSSFSPYSLLPLPQTLVPFPSFHNPPLTQLFHPDPPINRRRLHRRIRSPHPRRRPPPRRKTPLHHPLRLRLPQPRRSPAPHLRRRRHDPHQRRSRHRRRNRSRPPPTPSNLRNPRCVANVRRRAANPRERNPSAF